VKSLGFFSGFELDLVSWSQDFVRNWSPAIALNSLIPTIVIVILWLIKTDVYSVFLIFLLQCVVVSWCKCVDVNDSSMGKDFVVDQRRKAFSTQSKPDVAARCCVQKSSFSWVYTLQKLHRFTPV